MNEELKIIISAEVEKLKKGMQEGKKQVEELSKTGKEKFSEFNDTFQQVGAGAKKGLAIMGTAAVGAATALLALSASTEEYRANHAKLEAAFTTAGASADAAKQTYNDLYRVLGDDGQAVEAANHLAMLTTNQEDLAQYTTICQGVYATFGDSLPIEGLTEAVNHTAKLGEVQGSLADALEWAGISTDDFNAKLAACTTEAEREKLIRETLNGLYSDAAANYEESAAEILAQNEAQAQLNETTASLGEALAPINTMLTQLGTEILAQLTPHITKFVEEYGQQISDAFIAIGEAVGAVLGFIIENWELVSTIAIVIAAICAALTVFSTVMAIVNAVMMASPITWIILAIVAAIAAIIAIIVVCIKHWDEIKAATKKCWDAIVNAVKVAIDWVICLFEKIIGFVKENWQALLLMLVNPFAGAFKLIYDNCEGFRNTVDNLVKKVRDFFVVTLWENGIKKTFSNIGKWFSEKFTAASNGIKNAFSSIASFFTGIWEKIKSIFSKVGTAIADAVSGTVKKAINGVLSMAVKVINGFISAINFAIGVINAIPGVNIKKLSKLSVPALAKGGIVDSATLAVIGEQGKEAVVPLENNTEWIDKLAERIGSKTGGGNTPIVLEVDGRVFAKTSIDLINARTKQTGKLGLNIV